MNSSNNEEEDQKLFFVESLFSEHFRKNFFFVREGSDAKTSFVAQLVFEIRPNLVVVLGMRKLG